MTSEEREDAIQFFARWQKNRSIMKKYGELAIKALKQEPCEDSVSRGVFEQVMWERNVAIDQLKELGYGLGEKPKTGHWIVLSATDMYCSECNEIEHLDTSRKFCAYCGTWMVEPQESETGMSEEITREEIAALLARESEEQS